MRWVGISSIVAGIAGYVVILFATQTLGAERFEIFNVFWGLFFTLQGVVQGLMHETTRGVRALSRPEDVVSPTDELEGPDGALLDEYEEGVDRPVEVESAEAQAATANAQRGEGIRPLGIGGVVGLIAGGLVLATSPLWASAILPEGQRALGVALLAAAVAMASVQAVFAGLLSGIGRWRAYAVLMMIDALARVAVAAVATMLGDPVTGFLIATIAGVIAGPIIMLTPAGRSVLGARTDVGAGQYLARSAQAMLAASAAAILVVGFPVLIKATRPGADPTLLSNLLLAVTLTRAPILMPITSFQNAIVVYFVDRRDKGRGVVLRPVAVVLAIAAIGAALAWIAGPPIIELMGRGFSVGGNVLAALTFVAGLTGCLFITGSAVLARDRHGIYVAGWWVASGVAIAALLLTPGLVVGVCLALGVGPLAGSLVHVLFGLRPGDAAAVADRRAGEDLEMSEVAPTV